MRAAKVREVNEKMNNTASATPALSNDSAARQKIVKEAMKSRAGWASNVDPLGAAMTKLGWRESLANEPGVSFGSLASGVALGALECVRVTFNWPPWESVPAESNPTNDTEVLAGCLTRAELDALRARLAEAGLPEKESRPEYDQPLKPADDPEVMRWAGDIKQMARDLKESFGLVKNKKAKMLRAIFNRVILDSPTLVDERTGVSYPKTFESYEGKQYVDDRPRKDIHAPKGTSIATLLDRLNEAYRWATKPMYGQRGGDIKIEPIEWVWPGWIPLGAATMVVGAPRAGKGHLVGRIATHVITGAPWPDGSNCKSGTVIWYADEDSIGEVKQRLIAMGAEADLDDRFIGANVYQDGTMINLQVDMPVIKDEILEHEARMLVLDPWESVAGSMRGFDN